MKQSGDYYYVMCYDLLNTPAEFVHMTQKLVFFVPEV